MGFRYNEAGVKYIHMSPSGSRRKGKSFERQIVKLFRESFGLKPEECFRTPNSGGHPYAARTDPGDIQFCPEFRDWFNFHVECKNHRGTRLEQFFQTENARCGINRWLDQATCGPKHLRPMLVFQTGRGTAGIYCAVREAPAALRILQPYAVFEHERKCWTLLPFANFLLAYGTQFWRYDSGMNKSNEKRKQQPNTTAYVR